MLRGLRTISASSTARRNEVGSSNGASRSAAVPMPGRHVRVRACAAAQPVLLGEARGGAVVALEPEPGVGGLEDVDRAGVLLEQRARGRRVEAVERVRHVDEAALRADALERLGERQAARDLLVQEQPDDLAVGGGLDLRADDDVQRQAALDRARARLDAARDRVVIGDRERAEARCERRVEQLVDRRRAIPRVPAVHVQVGQHAAGACAHGVTPSAARSRPARREPAPARRGGR